jgi:hypothetical protein
MLDEQIPLLNPDSASVMDGDAADTSERSATPPPTGSSGPSCSGGPATSADPMAGTSSGLPSEEASTSSGLPTKKKSEKKEKTVKFFKNVFGFSKQNKTETTTESNPETNETNDDQSELDRGFSSVFFN